MYSHYATHKISPICKISTIPEDLSFLNPRSRLNYDHLHPNRKGKYMVEHNFSTFINNSYSDNLYNTSGISEDCISNSQNSDEIRKEVKSSKDHDAFSLLRKQRVEFS